MQVRNSVIETIVDNKIVAIIRGIGCDRMLDTVGALLRGGIKLVEVTFEHDNHESKSDTEKSIVLIKKEYGNLVCLGAGTVLTVDQVDRAADAGAEFIISPNMDFKIINRTKELSKISIPGVLTPTEIVTAFESGADIVKLFPAGIVGAEYIRALLAPLRNISIMAVGGVNSDNFDQFLNAGAKCIGIGGGLVDREAIYSGDYNSITKAAKLLNNKLLGL